MTDLGKSLTLAYAVGKAPGGSSSESLRMSLVFMFSQVKLWLVQSNLPTIPYPARRTVRVLRSTLFLETHEGFSLRQ